MDSPDPSKDRDQDRDEPRAKKQRTGGFKWKEKPPSDFDDSKARGSNEGGLKRGYRDRSPRRDSYRDRERDRERDRSPARNSYADRERDRDRKGDEYRERSPPRRDRKDERDRRDSYRPGGRRDEAKDVSQSAAEKFGLPATKSEKKDKPKKAPKVSAPTEPMIVVNINDRLGTKAAIPCLASDSVKAFKAIVAAHIGRQPHEIMLKRQGERPFKDQLTLEDYGVSSGVQLDLEIDTGD